MMDTSSVRAWLPVWVWVVAAFGITWNVFGLVQLADFIMQTRASLMMNGMTPNAVEIYYTLPAWMKVAFAIGSVGGLAGSLALAGRQRLAIPIFVASLLGYIALYVGDYAYGVFDVISGQMAVLSVVVAIAVALLGASLAARRQGLLRHQIKSA